jgi:dTDP-4-amino-4,6-dideoxygalactose transaminase
VAIPPERDEGHVYHLFPVLVEGEGDSRAALQQHLRTSGIDTLIHYPIPIHRQQAFADLQAVDCPHADDACARVLSLPLHPALDGHAVASVADALRSWPKP